MKLESARRLKANLLTERVSRQTATRSALPRAAHVTVSALPETAPRAALALGIKGKGDDYRLAVRVVEVTPGLESVLETIRRRSRGEVDIRIVGRIVKQQPWHQRRNRPLRIGGSVGHTAVTAGTLGCFVTLPGQDHNDLILSNNHVLANENNASVDDAVIQQAREDGGGNPPDLVARLTRFEPLEASDNLVDAAVAELDFGIEYAHKELEGMGPITGIRTDPLEDREIVYKIGRTTGLTRGRVSAIEVDDVVVGGYNAGDLAFDNQIEITRDGDRPFSLGGDSGSVIVDRYRRVVALLFAGNDVDVTYANPIKTVLDTLGVEIAI